MDSYLKVGSYNRFYGLRMKYFFLLEGGMLVFYKFCAIIFPRIMKLCEG